VKVTIHEAGFTAMNNTRWGEEKRYLQKKNQPLRVVSETAFLT
jgi:hypothetical protein